jgi:hypothetical protein
LISPPQEQKNFWVALEVRAFLLAWAMSFLLVTGVKTRYGFFQAPGIYCVKSSMKNSEMSTYQFKNNHKQAQTNTDKIFLNPPGNIARKFLLQIADYFLQKWYSFLDKCDKIIPTN